MNQKTITQDINWFKIFPFFLLHLAVLSVFFIPFQTKWIYLCAALYFVQMFGITAGFHRYFSHRSYRTSRVFQFILPVMGSLSIQKGVLWWAANHRIHHKHSGQKEDIHAPEHRGFWWSHVGWILVETYDETQWNYIKDFKKYPELVWLNKYNLVPTVILSTILLATGGWGALVWGYLLSVILNYHCTFFINSLCHMFGKRRFTTTDDSRNSFLLALVTFGEGWHNNHHYYQQSARQGFYWWEIDLTFYVLKFLSFFKIVWDFRAPPKSVYDAAKVKESKEKTPTLTLAPDM